MWVDLIQSVEGLRKRLAFLEEEGTLPAKGLGPGTAALPEVSILLTYAVDSGLVKLLQSHKPIA